MKKTEGQKERQIHGKKEGATLAWRELSHRVTLANVWPTQPVLRTTHKRRKRETELYVCINESWFLKHVEKEHRIQTKIMFLKTHKHTHA
jgi:hypothetical protein